MSEVGIGVLNDPARSGSSPDANAAFNEGLRRAQACDYAGALHWLRQAEALEAERADTLRLLGKVSVRLGDLDQAEACFQRAMRIDPKDAAGRTCLETLWQFRLRRRGLAVTACLAAGILICAGLWYSLSRIRKLEAAVAEIGNRGTAATSAAHRDGTSVDSAVLSPVAPTGADRVPINKNQDEPRQKSTEVHPPSGTLPTADNKMSQKPAPAPLFKERYREAVGLALAGDLRGAIPKLEKLATGEYADEPLAANVHFWLGRCLFGTGEIRRALEHFRAVTEAHAAGNKTGEALIDCGRCYARLGEKERGIETWERVRSGSFDQRLVLLAERLIEREQH